MSSPNQDEVRKALDTLLQAPNDALSANRAQVLSTFVSLSKRLKVPDDKCVDFLDTLEKSMEQVEKLTSVDINSYASVSSSHVDIRLQHINAIQSPAKDKRSLIRALFALRSLGHEYDDYFQGRYGISRVKQIAQDPRKADNKNEAQIQQFLEQRGYNTGPPERNGLGLAIRLLVFEEICKTPGISLLVIHATRKLRYIKYTQLPDIASLLGKYSTYEKTGTAAETFGGRVTDGQKTYNGALD
ncbi:hypothetical protein MauCBS54593_000032 [Microsporum audouinii]